MDRNELEQIAASAIYGEISAEEKQRLDEWLAAHPEDRAEFDELLKTRSLLDMAGDVAAGESRVHASQIVSMDRPGTSWNKRWAGAAAACLAFLFCVSQGMVIQVGTIRLALGPAADSQALRREIDRELAANYLPAVNELIGTVDLANSNWKLLGDRQNSLEESLQVFAALRNEDRQFQERSIKQFATMMDREVDRKFGNLYYASMPPLYNNNLDTGVRVNDSNTNPTKEFNHEK